MQGLPAPTQRRLFLLEYLLDATLKKGNFILLEAHLAVSDDSFSVHQERCGHRVDVKEPHCHRIRVKCDRVDRVELLREFLGLC